MDAAGRARRIRIRLFDRDIYLSLRLLLATVAVVLIPVTGSLLAYARLSADAVQAEAFRSLRTSVQMGKNNLDYRLDQIEVSSLAILTSVYPALNSDADTAGQMAEYTEMSRLMMDYVGKNMITKLRLYVPDAKVYSHQRDTFYSLKELEGTEFSPLRIGTYWLPTHGIALSFGEKPIDAITCETAISSATDYSRIVGVLFVDIAVAQIDKMLAAGIGPDESLFLVDADGTILSHPDAARIGTVAFSGAGAPSFAEALSGSGAAEVDGRSMLYAYSRLEAADWFVVMTEPQSRVSSAGFLSLDLVRLLLLLVVLVSLVAAVLLIYRMVVGSTFQRLNTAIGELERENRDPTEPPEPPGRRTARREDPSSLFTLERNTDRMIRMIHTLLDRQYKNQIAAHRFHMQALQAQINPHFLYNTLDVIKWMIADGERDDSIWMVNALSKYFQLSISKGKDIVRLRDEIGLTRTYLGIMQKRFKNVFEVSIEIEPALEDCLIPKLSLQPLVENALLHGILYCEKPERLLSIRAARLRDDVVLSVEDNGSGIPEETLRSIREGTVVGKNYGISNVRERLELFGAGEDGFSIESTVDVGTCVTLRFPLRRVEEPSR